MASTTCMSDDYVKETTFVVSVGLHSTRKVIGAGFTKSLLTSKIKVGQVSEHDSQVSDIYFKMIVVRSVGCVAWSCRNGTSNTRLGLWLMQSNSRSNNTRVMEHITGRLLLSAPLE